MELWRAKVPHSTIRSQLKMLKSPSGVAFKNDNVFSPIINRMPGIGWEKKEQEGQEGQQEVAAN